MLHTDVRSEHLNIEFYTKGEPFTIYIYLVQDTISLRDISNNHAYSLCFFLSFFLSLFLSLSFSHSFSLSLSLNFLSLFTPLSPFYFTKLPYWESLFHTDASILANSSKLMIAKINRTVTCGKRYYFYINVYPTASAYSVTEKEPF